MKRIKKLKRIKVDDLKNFCEETSKMIQEGNSKTLSSTGTPMSKLKGAARYTAQKAAIGGGSKAIGGGGMEYGDKIIDAYSRASTALKMSELLNNSSKKVIDKKK